MITGSELKRLLKSKGCTFAEGTNHTKIYLGEKSTIMPRHPKREVKTGTLKAIFRELGLKA